MAPSWWSKLFSGRRTKSPYTFLGKPKNPREGDRMILSRLTKLGAEMTKAREVRHYLYLPSQEAASSAAKTLRSEGYEAEERLAGNAASNPPNPWLVLAKIEGVVNDETVEQMRQVFETLASEYSGDYDGWEAAAKP
jgi:hypothetical protein